LISRAVALKELQRGIPFRELPGIIPHDSPTAFPPPWSVEELDACFVVRDHNGQQLAYVYFEDEPGRRSAANIAKLPELLRKA
jgi:hypothetical protein